MLVAVFMALKTTLRIAVGSFFVNNQKKLLIYKQILILTTFVVCDLQ